jgi:hypothetical protein
VSCVRFECVACGDRVADAAELEVGVAAGGGGWWLTRCGGCGGLASALVGDAVVSLLVSAGAVEVSA